MILKPLAAVLKSFMSEITCLIEPVPPLESPWSRSHVHAPHGDETYVAVPALNEAIDAAHRNHERLGASRVDIQGRELSMLRRWARREVYRAACEFTAQLLGRNDRPALSDAELDATAFYVGGHQPTLFHPGVWVKNFVIGGLARRDRALGLNLVVDTDTLSGTTIRVPGGSDDEPELLNVAFDEPRARQPWEEARILNRELFATFPGRVLAALGDGRFRPIVGDFWPAAVQYSQRSTALAECLTAARWSWERSWGLDNLELPVSRLCTLEPFSWFAAHILAQLPRFQDVYNSVLREYRGVNRVRSRTHPVPDLRTRDGWLEAPFRVWRAGDQIRKPVYARQFAGEIHLSDGENVFAVLPLTPEGEACCAVKELQKLPAQGIRLRTRALTTTLFARLCVGDLFVHGIGGAKYDQMTDRITARFFKLAAPEFLSLSGTLRLPAAERTVHPADEARLRRLLRELDYNSDRHLSPEAASQAAPLVSEKERLIAEQRQVRTSPCGKAPCRGSGTGYERFRRLQQLNRQLAAWTLPDRRRIEDELSRTRHQLAANGLWHDREYASCLYPAEKLRRFLEHVCASIGS